MRDFWTGSRRDCTIRSVRSLAGESEPLAAGGSWWSILDGQVISEQASTGDQRRVRAISRSHEVDLEGANRILGSLRENVVLLT